MGAIVISQFHDRKKYWLFTARYLSSFKSEAQNSRNVMMVMEQLDNDKKGRSS